MTSNPINSAQRQNCFLALQYGTVHNNDGRRGGGEKKAVSVMCKSHEGFAAMQPSQTKPPFFPLLSQLFLSLSERNKKVELGRATGKEE